MKITENDVLAAQKAWGDAIIKAGEAYQKGFDLYPFAKRGLQYLYGFGERDVLFKPTRANDVPFRSTLEEAISYFIGGIIKEDTGFAMSMFQRIVFDNYKIVLYDDEAFAIGRYTFMTEDGNSIVAEYTLGYYLSNDQNVKIFLHHSSFPAGEVNKGLR